MKNVIKMLSLAVALFCAHQLSAQEAYVGEIRMFAGNYAPSGWAICDGRALPVQNNMALFSILGTTYGGDGRTVFNIPDLRGRVPMGAGLNPALGGQSQRVIGQTLGTLTNTNIQANYLMTATPTPPTGTTQRMSWVPTAPTEDNVQPSLVINYIICLNGIYPTRD